MLGVVLAAMVIGLSLITALLGLSFTTQRAAIAQQELARERRAADGALEAGLTGVLANTAAAADPCDAPAVPSTVDMDVDGEGAEDKVALVCEPILDPDPDAEGKVVVVGPGTGLAHSGGEPVRFAGDVQVKGSADVQGPSPDGPGMVVAGGYAQGEACAGATTPGPNQIRTTEGDPVCPDTDAEDVSGTPAPVDPPTVVRDASYVSGVLPLAPCDPLVPGSATFDPGRYTPGAVKVLNDRFDDDCNATYHFQPGTYWFDGASSSVLPGTDALVFADPGSSFAFGELKASSSPPSCDPDGGTADVVLSGATTFHHTGGNVTICGSLAQARRTYSKPTLNVLSHNFFTNGDKLLKSPQDVADKKDWPSAPGAKCSAALTFCPKFTAAIEANGDELIESLTLRWHSWVFPNVIMGLKFNPWPELGESKGFLNLRLLNPDGTVFCGNSTPLKTGRTPAFGSELDLLTEGGCSTLKDQPQRVLNDLRVQMTVWFDPACNPAPLGDQHCDYYALGHELVVNEETVEASSPSGLATIDTGYVLGQPVDASQLWVTEDCRDVGILCYNDPPRGPTSKTQSSYDPPDGVPLGDDLTSLVVSFSTHPSRLHNGGANMEQEGRMKAEVTLAGGATCNEAEVPGYTSSPRTYFLDLSDCLATIGPNATVGDATGIGGVAITFTPEIDADPIVAGILGAEMPWLDYVRLSITTDTNHTVRPATVTADAGVGTRFRVYGDTNLPMTDLDVKWSGAGETSDESIFNGNLVVNTLLSTGSAGAGVGVVCCGPLYPTSQLVAYTENPAAGVVRGIATLRFIPGADPLDAPTPMVTDWQLCSLAGCETNQELALSG